MITWLFGLLATASNPRLAFEAARPRFITEDITIDGVAYVRQTDPVLNVRLAVDAPNRAMLGWLFRGKWMRVYEQH